jgi:hypothetical protein
LHLFWKRADGLWYGYEPALDAKSLATALAVIHEDREGCFFG